MITQLVYSALHLGYSVGLKELSFDEKVKVKCIEDINTIQINMGKGPLSPKQFDLFWDSTNEELCKIIHDQAAILHPY